MKVSTIQGDITNIPADAAIVNLFEGVTSPGGATGAVDREMGHSLSQLIADGEIKGKRGELTLVHTFGKIAPSRVLVLGLGKQEDFSLETIRNGMAEACRYLRRIGVKKVSTIIHGAGIGGMDPQEAAQAMVEGALLGLYTFNRHKSANNEDSDIDDLVLVEREAAKLPAVEKGAEMGQIIAEATIFTRDLANEPSNFMTPTDLADAARMVADQWGLECTILEREQMKELGMGALLGVAQGSAQPPKLIALSYKGDPSHKEDILGLVGKGVTFDSGGISIKPAEGMSSMKTDMAGGAAVIGAMQAIARLKPRANVLGVVPAAENLPSGTAQKPGDVVRAMNGKTIEVENTDAEGRLLLADAMCYAKSLGASRLVDVATLTGAIRVALGTACSGAFGNDRKLMEVVTRAGEKAGERVWELPLFDDYKEQIRSDVADLKNTGGQPAGSITAAKFLAEFSGDTPWVHLDVAATARSDRDKGFIAKGATGVPVRTLVNVALELAKGD